ncbi:MAG: TIR domain-containing protein [Bacteroidales bacterium]|nr:TIR domain-containing protein [Bacteroides sp.]MCM1503102.1 TIR domain-containing protein [Bacteroidales bacterium]
MAKNYDIFISYRRKSGAIKAEFIKSTLIHEGIHPENIFLDHNSIKAENYILAIKEAIRHSRNMIVIITQECFKNIDDKSVWTTEIRTAMEAGINIVPIYFDDIKEIPADEMPHSIQNFSVINAILYSNLYPEASLSKMLSFLDLKKTKNSKTFINKKHLYILLCCLILILTTMAILFKDTINNYIRLVTTPPLEMNGIATDNIHKLIDLGLPSRTLWLDRNLGAGEFYEHGFFLSASEIKPKPEYSKETYAPHIIADSLAPMSKDAAWVLSNGDWCIPTDEQWQELIEKCTWETARIKGIIGKKVTGENGNAIFIPACGMYNSKGHNYKNKHGYYWSSSNTVIEDYSRECLFSYSSEDQQLGNCWSYCGRNIRPVNYIKPIDIP